MEFTAEGLARFENEPSFAEEVIPAEMAAALSCSIQDLEKFIKLPARPLNKRPLQGHTQVNSVF